MTGRKVYRRRFSLFPKETGRRRMPAIILLACGLYLPFIARENGGDKEMFSRA